MGRGEGRGKLHRALERFNSVLDKPPKISKTTNEHNSILISYLAGTYCYVT